MNDKQKTYAIVGTLAFVFWLFYPYNYYTPFDFFDDSDEWFEDGIQIFAFAVSVACGVAYKLFEEK